MGAAGLHHGSSYGTGGSKASRKSFHTDRMSRGRRFLWPDPPPFSAFVYSFGRGKKEPSKSFGIPYTIVALTNSWGRYIGRCGSKVTVKIPRWRN